MEKIIFEKLLPFLYQWKTKKGFWAICSIAVVIVSSQWLVQKYVPTLYLCCALIAVFLIWILTWFILSGRIIFPTSRKIVIFCFNVDSEAHKNHERVLKRIYSSINEFRLTNKIKVFNIARDVITDKVKAHKYREKNKVDLIIWGNAEYGNLNSQKVSRFDLHYTMSITQSLSEKLNLFLADVSLILAKKDWTIKEVNELEEFKVISNNLFETILFIIGIYLYDEKHFPDSIRIFESILPIVVEKENKKEYIEYYIQAGRIRSLLAEQYFLYARQLHDNGDINGALIFYKKIPEHIPNPIPLFIMLANTYFLAGDEINAKKYTEEVRKRNKRHPAVCLNYAFFGIREKNFDRVKFWYDELLKHKILIDIDIFSAELVNSNETNILFI